MNIREQDASTIGARAEHVPPTAELVSVVVIFLDAERFLREAVDSVLGQSYPHWELLLVDDGSSDGGSAMARAYAAAHAGRVRYLDHPGHANRGMSASRNLGIAHATGRYIAFLDADDVWLPEKLERQVELMRSHPDVGMVYGPATRWFGWTGRPEDAAQDAVQDVGAAGGTVLRHPEPLRLYLRDHAVSPSISGILVAADAVRRIGGFEETFRGMYEDQVFYVKLTAEAAVLVSEEGWHRYRHHPDSCCAVAFRTGTHDDSRRAFLGWALRYLEQRSVASPDAERLLRSELARMAPPGPVRALARSVAKRLLPEEARRWLRSLESAWLGSR